MNTHRLPFTALLTLIVLCSPASGAPAQQVETTLSPALANGDYSGQSRLRVDLEMIPAEREFVVAPGLEARYGLGWASLGLRFSGGWYTPEEGSSEFSVANPVLDLKAHGCTDGPWRLCYGGSLALGSGLFELGDQLALRFLEPGEPPADDPERYRSYERLVVRPMAMLALTDGRFQLQLEAGPSLWIPWYIVHGGGQDLEALLHYHLAVGCALTDWFSPLVELRGVSALSEGAATPWLWVNVGARFRLWQLEPTVRLSIPLGDNADAGMEDAPLQVALGLAYRF